MLSPLQTLAGVSLQHLFNSFPPLSPQREEKALKEAQTTAMASPSFPVFLDPPNWNQQQELHLSAESGDDGGINNGAPRATPPPSFVLPRSEVGLLSSTRPGSMHWRARLAKLPRPEQALKCPRCGSTNTKFCYFNNYSLSQPRHFCKACRRYWTRGGALRNVPVGGGCRKSKRDKAGGSGSSSKFSTKPSTAVGTAGGGAALESALTLPPRPPQMTSFPHPTVSEGGDPNSGLNFTRIQALDYEVSAGAGLTSSVGFHNLGLQQEIDQRTIFPLITLGELATPPPPASLVPSLCMHPASLQGDGSVLTGRLFMGHCLQPNVPTSSKMNAYVDDAQQRLGRLPRQVSGGAGNNNDLIWGGSADDHEWGETSGFFNFNS